jgi:hypothetical protein
MRKYGRTDANHTDTVKALRQIGCSVVSLGDVGGGVPDLLVGRGDKNMLLEVKDGTRKPSERRLTEDEQKFLNTWRGRIAVVFSPEEAVKYVLANS